MDKLTDEQINDWFKKASVKVTADKFGHPLKFKVKYPPPTRRKEK